MSGPPYRLISTMTLLYASLVAAGCGNARYPTLRDDDVLILTPQAITIRPMRSGDEASPENTATFTIFGGDTSGRPREAAHVDVLLQQTCEAGTDGAVTAGSGTLSAGTGCELRTDTHLQCILGVSGTATFSTTGAPPASTGSSKLAVSVRPTGGGNQCADASVTIANGLPSDTKLDIAVDDPQSSPIQLSCNNSQALTCDPVRAWPISLSLVRDNGDAATSIDIRVYAKVHVNALGHERVWFATATDCPPAPTTTLGATLEFDPISGRVPIPVFACTRSSQAPFQITGSVFGDGVPAGIFNSVAVPAPGAPAQLAWRRLDASTYEFSVNDCEGQALREMPSMTFSQSGNDSFQWQASADGASGGTTVTFASVNPGVPILVTMPSIPASCSVPQ